MGSIGRHWNVSAPGRESGPVGATLLYMLCLALVLIILGSLGVMLLKQENQRQTDRLQLAMLSDRIASTIARRFYIIEALAENDAVRDLLYGDAEQDNPQVRLVLNTANNLAHSELIWVMNRQGVVQSSSDYQDGTLTGIDYSFRPYFQGAMQGREVVFPAVGATTKTRGFYLSVPVPGDQDGDLLGVIALKIPIQDIDEAMAESNLVVLLASPDGVVFSGNKEEWFFRLLRPLSPETLAEIEETRQFGNMELAPLGLDLMGSRVQLDGEEYRVLHQPLSIPGWTILALQPITPEQPLTKLQKQIVATALVVIGGLAVLVFLLLHNIRRRLETEAGLRLAEEKYRSIFENAMEGIFQTTPGGTFLSANKAMAGMLGYDSARELMAAVTDIAQQNYVDPQEREELVRALQEFGEVREFNVVMRSKDGRHINVSLSARLAKDKASGIEYFEGFCVDISKRKQAEEQLAQLNRHLEQLVAERTRDLDAKARELEQANEQLLQLDALKSMFLTTVSHDLRTPLTSILGFAKLIRREFARHFLVDEAKDQDLAHRGQRILANLMIIGREGERLTRLVNDFLDLSRIESGSVVWHDTDVAPGDIVAEAVDAVRGQFAGKPEVDLVVEVPENLPLVRVDQDKIAQVLVNLMGNAAKFTAKGKVTVGVEAREDHLRVMVKDTGCGIPVEERKKVFDKFHKVRSDDTMSQKPAGTGLGLAICQNIVAHYGGEIWIESSPDSETGCIFIFTLPLA